MWYTANPDYDITILICYFIPYFTQRWKATLPEKHSPEKSFLETLIKNEHVPIHSVR